MSTHLYCMLELIPEFIKKMSDFHQIALLQAIPDSVNKNAVLTELAAIYPQYAVTVSPFRRDGYAAVFEAWWHDVPTKEEIKTIVDAALKAVGEDFEFPHEAFNLTVLGDAEAAAEFLASTPGWGYIE